MGKKAIPRSKDNMTKDEGRGKDLPTEIPSETQRMMIRDMRDFRITGINPFDHDSYNSENSTNIATNTRSMDLLFSW